MTQIPIEIVNAINAMLAPYGEQFSPRADSRLETDT